MQTNAATGDGGGGAYELIQSQVLASTTTSITFASIPQTYKHFQVRYAARGSRAAATDFLGIYFNADTATNYWYHYLSGNGSAVSETYIVGAEANIRLGDIPAANNDANVFGSGVIDVANYASTSIYKTTKALNGYLGQNGGTSNIGLRSGFWLNTAAVTSATFVALNAGFLSGSRFSLYGIKG